MSTRPLDWLNTLLVIDTFFVLFSFLWLVIAVIGHQAGLSLGLAVWYQLWQPVFTPALGILMAGALVSALVSRLLKYLPREKQKPHT